jgi:GR25 family glycosyltransferase involved in LPS biosynthesis
MILENSYKAFINLEKRKDRLRHMQNELKRIGIKAERFNALTPDQYKGSPASIRTMLSRPQRGAIGCHISQVAVMNKALSKEQHAFVMEDDLVFASDFLDRMNIFDNFLEGKEWDVIWLGGTYHKEPTWHKVGHSQLNQCSCNLNRDYEKTDNPKIVRTYGAWSTYAYIVNVKSIEKIKAMFAEHLHESIGIDWLFILLQPRLITYAFVPGCVKQMDGKSNIGTGDTIFSNFHKLGPHWFNDKM